MKRLHICVVDKVAIYHKRDGDIVCGNSDYEIKFIFDSEWDTHPQKTARFIWGGKFYDVDFSGDTCPVPIIQGAQIVEVGVYAGELNTTTSAIIPAKRSILCAGGLPSTENNRDYANKAKEFAELASTEADRAESAAELAEETMRIFSHQEFERWGAENQNTTSATKRNLNVPAGFVAKSEDGNPIYNYVSAKGVTIGGQGGLSMLTDSGTGKDRTISVRFNTDYKFSHLCFTWSGVTTPNENTSFTGFANHLHFYYRGGPQNADAFTTTDVNGADLTVGGNFYVQKKNGVSGAVEQITKDGERVGLQAVHDAFRGYASSGEEFTIHLDINANNILTHAHLECKGEVFTYKLPGEMSAIGCLCIWNEGWGNNNAVNIREITIRLDNPNIGQRVTILEKEAATLEKEVGKLKANSDWIEDMPYTLEYGNYFKMYANSFDDCKAFLVRFVIHGKSHIFTVTYGSDFCSELILVEGNLVWFEGIWLGAGEYEVTPYARTLSGGEVEPDYATVSTDSWWYKPLN